MASSGSREVWRQLSHSACRRSTLASVNGEVLAFGGIDAKGSVVDSIHAYSLERECWDVVDHMRVHG